MILRKPYAFLIKNFKRIHLVFVALGIYLVYQINIIYNFFKEVKGVKVVSGKELTDSLFNPTTYFIVTLLALLLIIVIWLLNFKKKKTLLYFMNLFFYIFLGLFYYYCYYQVSIMEITAIDIRIILFIYDLLGILMVLQVISIVSFAIRATGFDIKKFNFGQDIADLHIEVEDKEEFEVSFDFDVNHINKKLKQKLRFFKYAYVENRYIINLALCLIVFSGVLVMVLYMDNNRQFKEDTSIQTTNYILSVTKSYVTSRDYENNIIVVGKKFLLLKVNIQSRYGVSENLRLGMFELSIGDKTYSPTYDYYQDFIDIGDSYYNQIINTDKKTYLFAYLIDQDTSLNNANLNFYDGTIYGKSGNNNKIYHISLNPDNLDNTIENETQSLNIELTINNDFIISGSLNLTAYDINSRFKNDYQFCLTKTECYNSTEYLIPKYNSNNDKTLLKLSGIWSMYNKLDNLNNPAKFLQMYGNIVYTINGQTKTAHLNMGQVISNKNVEKDVYYLEVPKDVEQASTLSLLIQVRNHIYHYVLKANQ